MEHQINRPPRVRRTPEEIKELLAEQERSGKSSPEFATEKGIVLSTLLTWRRRYRDRSRTTPRWVEVSNVGSVVNSGPVAQVHLAEGLHINLHSGFEVEPMAALIKRLQNHD